MKKAIRVRDRYLISARQFAAKSKSLSSKWRAGQGLLTVKWGSLSRQHLSELDISPSASISLAKAFNVLGGRVATGRSLMTCLKLSKKGMIFVSQPVKKMKRPQLRAVIPSSMRETNCCYLKTGYLISPRPPPSVRKSHNLTLYEDCIRASTRTTRVVRYLDDPCPRTSRIARVPPQKPWPWAWSIQSRASGRSFKL